jgi:hypothetical protein
MEASPYIIITRLALINHSLPIMLARHEMSSYREEAGDVEAAPHHARQRRGRTVGGQLRRRRKWALSRSPACTEQPPHWGFLCWEGHASIDYRPEEEEPCHQNERRDDAAHETFLVPRQRCGRDRIRQPGRRHRALARLPSESQESPARGFPMSRMNQFGKRRSSRACRYHIPL